MEKAHEVQLVHVDETYLYLTVDGRSYRIRWADCSPLLAKATQAQRKRYEISASGYGIHWPDLDEDLSTEGLLRGAPAPHHPAKA